MPDTSAQSLLDVSLSEEDYTHDDFLGGAITLYQPKKGYRVSMDTVLLAACVPASPGDKVLEPGAGSCGASLCLAHRVPDIDVTAIEMQDQMIKLANHNISMNTMASRVSVMKADITDRAPIFPEGRFDHVMVNPPYLANGKALRPPEENKGLAHMDSTASLKDWIRFCLYNLKPRGTLSLVYRADRADEVIARLYGRFGDIKLFPLWPRCGVPAKRVLIQARKGVRGAMILLPGMVLHGEEERYTKETEAILRNGKALIL